MMPPSGPAARPSTRPSLFQDHLRANRWLQVLASSWVLGALVLALSWQPIGTSPMIGLDPSWSLAMQMAAVERLHWGTEFIFNYGPLGFLRSPLVANTWPAILSTIYLVLIRFALAVSVVHIIRRRFNVAIALLMAFVVVSLSHHDAAVPLAFVWCAVAVAEDSPGLPHRVVVFGGGALSGLELLVKLNEGVLIATMCLLAVTTMAGRRLRDLAYFALTLLVSAFVLWFAAGQGVANIDDFVTGSIQLVRGYSSALQTSGPAWEVAAVLFTWAFAVAAAWLTGAGLVTTRRLALVVLVLGFGFLSWKEGIVRQDPGHLEIFFALMLAPWIALRWRGREAWTLAAFAAVAILYFAATSIRPQDRLQPIDNTKAMVTDLRTVFDPGRRASVRMRALAQMRFLYGLDPRTLSLLTGKTVAVWPWESGIAWAYGLDWRPLPVTPSTAVYTSWLDQWNANALGSYEGPQRILRHVRQPALRALPQFRSPAQEGLSFYATSINGRYSPYDAPATTLAMLCHFRALRTTGRYQVLGRVSDRCGQMRFLASARADYGQAIPVPEASGRHQVVLARVFGAAPVGIEAVLTFLYRPPLRFMVFDDSATYRVVPGLLSNVLLLDAPRFSDFPKPFPVAPNVRAVAIRKDAAVLSPDRGLRFDFYAMRIRPAH
jgi:hypothetical protein